MIHHGHWTRVKGRNHRDYSPDNTRPLSIHHNNESKPHHTNPYHILSDNDEKSLQKLQLPNGSIIFTEYKTIEALYDSLKNCMLFGGANTINTNKEIVLRQNKPKQKAVNNTLKKDGLIARVRDHTNKIRTKNKKKNRHVHRIPSQPTDEITIEFEQILRKQAENGTPLTILTNTRKHQTKNNKSNQQQMTNSKSENKPRTPSKRPKTDSTTEDETMTDYTESVEDVLNSMRVFKQADTLDACLNDVEKYLRAYYAHTGIEPAEEYYELEPEEVLRQHLFEAVVDLLQAYEIGIKYDTSDSMIDDIDPVFVYKELHKVHTEQSSSFTIRDTVALPVDTARQKLKEYRNTLRNLHDEVERELDTATTSETDNPSQNGDDESTVDDISTSTQQTSDDTSVSTQTNNTVSDNDIM